VVVYLRCLPLFTLKNQAVSCSVTDNGEICEMGFMRFALRIGMGILLAFSWAFGAAIIGIHTPGSAGFPIFGFGIGIIFILGLLLGGNLAKNWFPTTEDETSTAKHEESSMK
jgi:hypothetical protein